jgi:glycosyltransferase involved in cell wall biosynthesis
VRLLKRCNSVWGVSLVICSHNGVSRLPRVLAHLALQRVPPGLLWEVVVVDNASTDGTAAVAKTNWPDNAPCPLRVVFEEVLGLTQARGKGLAEAKYELVSFIDDDNWPEHNWIQVVASVMARHTKVGACGGQLDPEYERTPPDWFQGVFQYCAIGSQSQNAGNVTWSRGYLWGAGLTVRKTAWKDLLAVGFRFQLPDRAGQLLTSGGDAELCLALRLAGWELWYEPTMRMKHYIPASRMQWKYFKRVARGFGVAALVLNAYATVRQDRSRPAITRMRSNWLCQVFITLLRLFRAYGRCFLTMRSWEGNIAVLEILYRRELLKQFLHVRTGYDALCRHIHGMSCSALASNVPMHQET